MSRRSAAARLCCMTIFYREVPSRLGTFTLTATERGLHGVGLPEHRDGPPSHAGWVHDPARLAEAASQLEEYLAGERTTFALELDRPAGTPFQQRVWEALHEIPYGRTESYGALAARIGAPRAVRAVGAANGRNPLAIVCPCHRVVGADGSLTGYGGGLPTKRALLALETGVAALPI